MDWLRLLDGEVRGQTQLDLLIGVSVFLITVGFVLITASGMIDPFVGGQERPLVADRTTAVVVEGMFSNTGTSAVLNKTCTYAFFDETLGEGDCAIPYDDQESDLATRLGIASRYSVNVTISRTTSGNGDLEVLCTDGESINDCPSGTRLATGPTPPGSDSVFAARRTAHLDGVDVFVEVILW